MEKSMMCVKDAPPPPGGLFTAYHLEGSEAGQGEPLMSIHLSDGT